MILFLDITSFRGMSVGAVHWYGRIKGKYGVFETIEVTRPMTAKEARQWNRETGMSVSWGYKPGEPTDRFDSKELLIEAAIYLVMDKYPKACLSLSSPGVCSARPIIYSPDNSKAIKRINKLAAEWEKINGYEGGKATRARKIDDEYMTLRKSLDGSAT